LDRVIKDGGIDLQELILRSDNGSKYISEEFEE